MLTILSVDICVSYLPYYTFVPIPRQSMQVYNVDEAALSVLCILYALVYVPAAFFTGPIVSFFGCRWTFVTAMAFNVMGCALRAGPALRSDVLFGWGTWHGSTPLDSGSLLSSSLSEGLVSTTSDPGFGTLPRANPLVTDFWWLVMGQLLCAVGQPLLVNPASEMAAEWFPPHERPKAALIANLMNFVGSSLSFVLPPLVVGEEHSSLQETELEISSLMRLQFWIAILAFLMTLLLYRPAPPSRMSSKMRAPISCIAETLGILRNRDFWLVNGFFTVYVSVCHAFDAVEGTILEHYGYSASLTSWTGISCAVASVLSTFAEAHCINSAEAYRAALLVAAAFMAASQFVGFACLQLRLNGGVFVAAVGIMGLSTPGWGCSCELGSEVCYPARESTVSAMLEAFSNLGGVFSIVFVQRLLDMGYGASVLAMLGLAQLAAATGLACLSGRLRRMEAESAEEHEKVEEVELRSMGRDEHCTVEKGDKARPAVNKWQHWDSPADAIGELLPRRLANKRSLRWSLSLVSLLGALFLCRVLLIMLQSQLPQDHHLPSLELWHSAPAPERPSNTSAVTQQPSLEADSTTSVLGDVQVPVGPPREEPMLARPVGPPRRPKPPSNATKRATPKRLLGVEDVPNYVISCSGKERRLARFRMSMERQGLNITLVPCSRGGVTEVQRAIKDGLLGPAAIAAVGGLTKKGLTRPDLLGEAISHLRLLQLIAGEGGPASGLANVFEDEEVLTSKFMARRHDLLQILQKVHGGNHFDMVKLDVKVAGGQKVRFSHPGLQWLNGNVFKMVPSLSPQMNCGLGSYIITKQGASKVLKLTSGKFDTFGRWETFDQFMLSRVIADIRKKAKKNPFVGFAVQTQVMLFNCHPGRTGVLSWSQKTYCKL